MEILDPDAVVAAFSDRKMREEGQRLMKELDASISGTRWAENAFARMDVREAKDYVAGELVRGRQVHHGHVASVSVTRAEAWVAEYYGRKEK